MKKKILIVITKGEVGGAQMSVLNLARELKKRGEEVELAFGEGEFLKTELEKENIKYHRFRYLRRTSNLVVNFLFAFEFKKFLKTKTFDVVHANSSNALFSLLGAKLRDKNIKTVFTFRGMSVLDENYHRGFFKKMIYLLFFKILLSFVDFPVFVSKHNFALAKKNNLIKKGYLVYNGLNYDNLFFLSKEEARQDLGLEENDFILGSIGRLAYQKNYEFLINILLELLKIKPELKLIILGDGPERKGLEELIKDLKLEDKVILKGSKPNAYRYLKAFDVFSLVSRYEGLSITLLEALKAGVPILASRVGGNPETLTNKQLFTLNDPDDYLEKFKALFGSREYLIKTNLEKSHYFSIQNTVSGYLRLYYDNK